MSLAIYMNQLICLVNDGSTSVWSIEELDHFQFGQSSFERRIDYFEDDSGFRWKLLEEISTDINSKFPRYLVFRIVHGLILMWNSSEVPFLLYDMLNHIFFPINIDNSNNEQISQFWHSTTRGLQ